MHLINLRSSNCENCIDYKFIIEDLTNSGYSVNILANVYRIEAFGTKKIPLVTNTSELIKKEFWKNYIRCDECNDSWILIECKKYSTLDLYLYQINQYTIENLDCGKIFNCFDEIEKMPHLETDQMIKLLFLSN